MKSEAHIEIKGSGAWEFVWDEPVTVNHGMADTVVTHINYQGMPYFPANKEPPVPPAYWPPQPAPGVWEVRTIELRSKTAELQLLEAIFQLLGDYLDGKWGGDISQHDEHARSTQAARVVQYINGRFG